MFLSSKNYLEQFRYLIKNSENLSLAVAFWGKGAETLIKTAWSGKRLRILCNLGCGGTNPKVILNLLKLAKIKPGLQVFFLDDLHAKVAVNQTAAIVGSANLSANGLGFEDIECSGWQEAGILINDAEQVSELQQWFDEQWARGEEVTEEHLSAVEEQWRKNRRSRPIGASSFTETQLTTLRDHDIYVAIYREAASIQAKAEIIEVRKDAKQAEVQGINADELDFYEGWPDDGDEPLPKDKPIISVYYESDGHVIIDGLWKRVPERDRTFGCNKMGEKIQLTVVKPAEEIGILNFLESNQKWLAKWLKSWIDGLSIGPETDFARCVPFDDFIDWKEKQSSGE